jgi:sensor histidine kinase YesM
VASGEIKCILFARGEAGAENILLSSSNDAGAVDKISRVFKENKGILYSMNCIQVSTEWSEEKKSEGRRRKFFWSFNISFWLVLALINLGANPNILLQKTSMNFLLLHLLSGILLGFLLHAVLYERFQFHLFPTWLLILLVLIYSVLFGVIRDYGWVLTSYVCFGSFPKRIQTIVYFANILRFTFYFVLWSLVYFALEIYEQVILHKQEAQQARLLAQTAQLEMLRYQLNPHFLFNTLSSLRALTTRNPQKAKEVVTKISEFLRYSLSEGNDQEVPLSKEIEIIRHYLDIERVQYGKKLSVKIDVSPHTEDVPIPIFLVHPLVENAVKHGMRTSSLPLKIALNAEMIGKQLLITVTNSGHWVDPSIDATSMGTSTGLANVRKRLEHFYPQAHSFEIVKENTAVRVIIRLKQEFNHGQTKKI